VRCARATRCDWHPYEERFFPFNSVDESMRLPSAGAYLALFRDLVLQVIETDQIKFFRPRRNERSSICSLFMLLYKSIRKLAQAPLDLAFTRGGLEQFSQIILKLLNRARRIVSLDERLAFPGLDVQIE
jgi:hypothetical protein